MRGYNWIGFILCILIMFPFGFLLFDNMTSTLLFGVVVGSVLGWTVTAKKGDAEW